MRQEDYLRIWEEFLETRMEEEVLALADSYPDKRSLYVPFKLLERFNQEIADDLLDHPKQVLSAGNEVLRSLDLPMDVTLGNAFLRVVSLPPTSRLKARNLREYHPGKFVALEGMVRMASKAFTAVTRVYVTCQRCGNGFMTSPARVKAGTIQCNNPACDRGGPYVKDIERSEKTAKRVIQLQENPEGLKGGELPETIGIILTGDLVENISPGNRVVVNGIVMLREIKSKAGDTLDYEHYIDAVSVEVIEREFEEIDISPEDERDILELSKSPTLIEDIRGSIAPTIYGQDDVKEAIALQLVSSPPVSHRDGTRTRGDIHILLVGDPGIAKSQILKYVIGLAPRGVYTSGKGSSTAGLCVAPGSKIWVKNKQVNIEDFVESYFDGRSVDVETEFLIDPVFQFESTSSITSVWKIPSPSELIGIETQYGEIKVTKETKVLSSSGWTKARDLRVGDSLHIPIGYGDWSNELPEITKYYPETLRIKNRSDFFQKICSRIASKKELIAIGINENKVYHTWIHDEARGAMTLKELRAISEYSGISLEEVINGEDLLCEFRSGVYFKLPTKFTTELAYFVGLIAGDGNIPKKKSENSAAIVFSNNDLLEEYADLVRNLFGKEVIVTPQSLERARSIRFWNMAVYRLLVGLGIKKPGNLLIPTEIQQNRELLVSYLRGLYDTDGSVYERGEGGKWRANIELTTIYQGFAKQIQSSLLRLGIASNIVEVRAKTTTKSNGAKINSKKQYRVYVSRKPAIMRFAETVGFGLTRKKEKLESIVQEIKKRNNSEDGDFVLAKVKRTEVLKSEYDYVYDLTIEGSHYFVANGLLIHNTAAAVKDEMSDGRWTIEAGALPMADMGMAAIDELDKMADTDRDALHEGLEQQSISVAKAGITATLRCRCSVLAAANPKLGRFDLIEPISSQIKLAPTLLSRFDLIFVLFDTPEQELDSRISSHILNVYMDDSVATPPIPPELLRKYIAYARRTITPQMTQESSKALQEYYLGVRAQYNSGPNQPVPTTARQLQALMRLSVASARLRLSNIVELQDANRAIALTDACLRKVGIDQNTGNYDAGAIDTGFTKTHVDAISTLKTIIRDICKNNNGIAPALDILKAATEAGLNEDRAQKVLERMRMGTEIMEPRPGYYRLV